MRGRRKSEDVQHVQPNVACLLVCPTFSSRQFVQERLDFKRLKSSKVEQIAFRRCYQLGSWLVGP